GSVCLMVGPAAFCLMRPQMFGHVITFVVAMVIYGAIHFPMMVILMLTVNRTGYGLNHVIDIYRLRIPWAPIGISFWAALCGLLMMAGRFGLAFFVLLALWEWKTSEAAARICAPDSRAIIAIPLPPKPAPKEKSAPKVQI